MWPGVGEGWSGGRGKMTGVEEKMEARGGYGEKGTQADKQVSRENRLHVVETDSDLCLTPTPEPSVCVFRVIWLWGAPPAAMWLV